MVFKPLTDTEFIGKRVMHYQKCTSTNAQASELAKLDKMSDGDIVIADFQSEGKGQAGNSWNSAEGENLTFSIFLSKPKIALGDQFNINMAISLAIMNFYREILGNSVKVKWPNDVMYGRKKLSGILIENSISQRSIEHSIIGLGLNINQEEFGLATAISPSAITGRKFNLESLFEAVCMQIESYLNLIRLKRFDALRNQYLRNLYGFKEELQFKDTANFVGTIVDVDREGRLMIEKEGITAKYSFKEVTFL